MCSVLINNWSPSLYHYLFIFTLSGKEKLGVLGRDVRDNISKDQPADTVIPTHTPAF